MRVLHEALRPPDGYELDCAIGTTFTLDLVSLLSVPLAVGRFAGGEDGPDECDPLELLASIERSADRITVFHQAGAIRVPEHHRELLTLVESSLVGVSLRRGALFHPKVWIARYVNASGPVRHRAIVLSRNLTRDRSWDTMVVVEGEKVRSAPPNSGPMGDFLDWLARRPGMASQRQATVRSLARSVTRARFIAPAPFKTVTFRPLGIPAHRKHPITTARRDRLLVVSPFIGDDQLSLLSSGTAESVLVTRAEELGRLAKPVPAAFSATLQLDDALEPEPDDSPSSTTPLVGLHAKLYCADQGWDATVWTGSANGTSAAFGLNVEVLVEMTGKKSVCGVSAFVDDDSPGTFGSMLRPVEGAPPKPPDEDMERKLDGLASEVAALPLEVEAHEDEDTWRLVLRAQKGASLPDELEVHLSPLASAASPRPLDLTHSPVAEFDRIAPHEVSGLFVVELRVRAPRATRAFVARWPLVGEVPDRVRALLARLVTDRERLVAFLRLLLGNVSDAPELTPLTSTGGKGEEWRVLADATPVFELLVKTLAASPERLDAIAHWIPQLAAAAGGEVESELLAIWNPVWEARQEALR